MKRLQRIGGIAGVVVISICGFAGQSAGAPAQPQNAARSAKATAPLRTFTGVITDGQCATKGSHQEVMKRASVNTEANCVKGCARRYGYVLYDPASKKIYKLNEDRGPSQLANQKVIVKGALDEATHTIYVSRITPAK